MSKSKKCPICNYHAIPFCKSGYCFTHCPNYCEVHWVNIPPFKLHPSRHLDNNYWGTETGKKCIIRFTSTYNSLPKEQKQRYKQYNPEPEGWTNFYQYIDR